MHPSSFSSAHEKLGTLSLRPDSLALALLYASDCVGQVFSQGRSLTAVLEALDQPVPLPPALKGAVSDLTHHALRHWGRAHGLTRLLAGEKDLKPEWLDDLLTVCMALLWDNTSPKYPAHTLTDQAVQAAAAVPELARAKGLINACLRRFLREREALMDQVCRRPVAVWNFPDWWIQTLKKQHPQDWQRILRCANEKPPLVLRVNRHHLSPQEYVAQCLAQGLQARVIGPVAVLLEKPVPVHSIPGFAQGHVSVQDSGAQLAVPLLGLRDGMRVLDACAAPGGKTGHLFEAADVHVTALDSDAQRLKRVRSNLERLNVPASAYTLHVADAARLSDWYDGQPFDAVLADVPCSGSGVVRRHPDIRWLRRPQDVANLSHTQRQILDALWSTVKPGGTLVLVNCSVFLEEGPQLAKAFTDRHKNAQAMPAPGHVFAKNDRFEEQPDGFFYACFRKTSPIEE